MSFDRNETREVLETVVIGGVELRQVKVSYNYQSWSRTGDAPIERVSYNHIEVAGTEGDDLAALNQYRIVLEALAQADGNDITLGDHDVESLVEIVEEHASETAEELEIHFIYDRNGRKREYTPKSLWEPSGGCEWEESATEYDYGWDL